MSESDKPVKASLLPFNHPAGRTVSERAQDVLAVAEYIKESLVTPFLENARMEMEERKAASEREVVVIEKQLARKHSFDMRLVTVTAAITLLVVVGALVLLFMGKTVEGMWLLSTVFCIGGSGGAVFGFTQARQRNREE